MASNVKLRSLPRKAWAALLAVVLSGCALQGKPPVAPESASTSPWHLRQVDRDLVVPAVAGASWPRGTFLKVIEPVAVSGGKPIPRPVGILLVADPSFGKVDWYCAPNVLEDDPLWLDRMLNAGGLVVEPFKPDTIIRVGKCFSVYEVDSQEGDLVALKIPLGKADGIRPDELYELLGRAQVSGDPPMVTSFDELGRCTIDPHRLETLQAICLLDRGAWPKTAAWRDQGRIHLVQKR